eukprot:Hpha_TRINITY_DN30091_c0_g1::TRINITY_DN30091_c0_g1_i1::g.21407::m.21407
MESAAIFAPLGCDWFWSPERHRTGAGYTPLVQGFLAAQRRLGGSVRLHSDLAYAVLSYAVPYCDYGPGTLSVHLVHTQPSPLPGLRHCAAAVLGEELLIFGGVHDADPQEIPQPIGPRRFRQRDDGSWAEVAAREGERTEPPPARDSAAVAVLPGRGEGTVVLCGGFGPADPEEYARVWLYTLKEGWRETGVFASTQQEQPWQPDGFGCSVVEDGREEVCIWGWNDGSVQRVHLPARGEGRAGVRRPAPFDMSKDVGLYDSPASVRGAGATDGPRRLWWFKDGRPLPEGADPRGDQAYRAPTWGGLVTPVGARHILRVTTAGCFVFDAWGCRTHHPSPPASFGAPRDHSLAAYPLRDGGRGVVIVGGKEWRTFSVDTSGRLPSRMGTSDADTELMDALF